MIDSKGFTLVELLIATSIIGVGLMGAFTAVQQGISAMDYSNSRFVAAFLAQEGVEVIKSMRDTNLLQSTTWNDGFSFNGDYELQYTDAHSLSPILFSVICSPDCFNDLHFLTKTNNGFYDYGPSSETKFKRKIRIENLPPDKIELEITVYWRKTGGGTHKLILKQHVYNWLNS
ncbi:MAG: prepilin-type N-terminal cleavage/methylation domain-containing protein [Patescibacteria group bacterium]|nr:prepilin-type N-terminal cleavage/methylation domain-containing protein [Patescibacteria group bacterium]